MKVIVIFIYQIGIVQDSVYIISDDHFWGEKAHQGEYHYINTPMTAAEKEKYGRTRAHMTNKRLKKNVDYETSCFLNGKETRVLNLDDEDNGDDDDLEDSCDNDPLEYEFVLSKQFKEDYGYRSNGVNINEDDEIAGISIAHIGHFVRTSAYDNLDKNFDHLPENGLPKLYISLWREETQRIVGVKQQGGLVNPVIPSSILRINLILGLVMTTMRAIITCHGSEIGGSWKSPN